jgi:hypothetical protein
MRFTYFIELRHRDFRNTTVAEVHNVPAGISLVRVKQMAKETMNIPCDWYPTGEYMVETVGKFSDCV